MIIQPGSASTAVKTAVSAFLSPSPAARAAKNTDTVSIPPANREALLASTAAAASNSTDTKLAEISEKLSKNPGSLTSAALEYQQKTLGFVNAMAYLSSPASAWQRLAVAP